MSTILFALSYLWNNKTVVVVLLFSILCLAFYSYYSYASNKIFNLNIKNIELSQVLQEKDRLIQSLKTDYENILVYKDELISVVDKGNKELESLRKKLYRDERNKKTLSELATKKTILVENAINKSTEKVLKCFEIISKNGDC